MKSPASSIYVSGWMSITLPVRGSGIYLSLAPDTHYPLTKL